MRKIAPPPHRADPYLSVNAAARRLKLSRHAVLLLAGRGVLRLSHAAGADVVTVASVARYERAEAARAAAEAGLDAAPTSAPTAA